MKLALTTINPKLSQFEVDLLNATQSTTVLELFEGNNIRLTDEINHLVSSNFSALGQKAKTEDEIALIVIGLIEEIQSYFPNLTMQELKIASNKGIRGEFGEFMGVNVITYHKFIKAFLNDEKRKDVILKQREYIEEQNRIKSQSEIAQIEKEFWENETKRIAEFKITGVLKTDNYETLYKIYEKAGKIDLSVSDKWEMFVKAKAETLKELRKLAVKVDNPKKINEQIKRIESKQTTKVDDLKIVDMACKMVMEDYYRIQLTKLPPEFKGHVLEHVG